MGVSAAASDQADRQFMAAALEQARDAGDRGEVPVGAVIVIEHAVVARAGNAPIGLHDPTAHAEVLALRAAGQALGNYRLPDATLYVTLEPCPMCAAALVHARVRRLVFAAADPRTGAAGSIMDLTRDARLNHRIVVDSGVMSDAASEMLQAFFREKRESER